MTYIHEEKIIQTIPIVGEKLKYDEYKIYIATPISGMNSNSYSKFINIIFNNIDKSFGAVAVINVIDNGLTKTIIGFEYEKDLMLLKLKIPNIEECKKL